MGASIAERYIDAMNAADIDAMMVNDRPGYFGNEGLHKEYRRLVDAIEEDERAKRWGRAGTGVKFYG